MAWKDRLRKYGAPLGIAVGTFFTGYLLRGYNQELVVPKRTGEKDFVYEGDIEGRNVNYRENVNVSTDGKTRKANVMTVKKGDDTYTLIDLDGTNVEWKLNAAPNYVNDKLERVEISRGENSYSFRTEDMNDSHLDGQRAKSMLEKGTKYFNDFRTKIREKKRVDYTTDLSKVEEFFGN